MDSLMIEYFWVMAKINSFTSMGFVVINIISLIMIAIYLNETLILKKQKFKCKRFFLEVFFFVFFNSVVFSTMILTREGNPDVSNLGRWWSTTSIKLEIELKDINNKELISTTTPIKEKIERT